MNVERFSLFLLNDCHHDDEREREKSGEIFFKESRPIMKVNNQENKSRL